jgi:hypothetical protein
MTLYTYAMFNALRLHGVFIHDWYAPNLKVYMVTILAQVGMHSVNATNAKGAARTLDGL